MKHMVRVRFDGNDIPGGPQQMLESLGISPVETKIEDVSVLRQLVVRVTLEWHDPTAPRPRFGRDQQCQVCDRNGYGLHFSKAPWRFVYREADIRDADDVNITWENAGFAKLTPNLRESLLSRPFMIVSPKVRRVFLDAGVTSFEWTPILVDAAD